MDNEAKLVYKPKYHVCSTYLWNYERRRGEYNFIKGMILQCTCSKYYELRTRSPIFGNWTISWNQSRLFWVEIDKPNFELLSENEKKNVDR